MTLGLLVLRVRLVPSHFISLPPSAIYTTAVLASRNDTKLGYADVVIVTVELTVTHVTDELYVAVCNLPAATANNCCVPSSLIHANPARTTDAVCNAVGCSLRLPNRLMMPPNTVRRQFSARRTWLGANCDGSAEMFSPPSNRVLRSCMTGRCATSPPSLIPNQADRQRHGQ